MTVSLKKLSHRLIWILTTFTLITYIVFETYTWGRYAYLGAALMILFLSASIKNWRFSIGFEPFYGFMFLFALYCLFSSLWAAEPSDSIQNAETVTLILICAMIPYIHYKQEEDIQKLLDAVRWAGFFVSIYAILFYGLDTLMMATSDRRVGNTFANINTIGMASALACVIQFHEFLYKRHRWSSIFTVPCIIVIAASQSRKALLLLLIGIVGVYLLKERRSRGFFVRLLKMVPVLVAAAGAILILYNLPIFEGIRLRMDAMIAGLLGQAGADQSTINRTLMQDLGWELFLQHPIGGVGMGNSHIYAGKQLGMDTYLHNNFAELLSGGGIVGFMIYYSMYIYLFHNLLKYKNADRKYFEIGFIWLALMLILDYGMVSYYSKAQWFYLMIHFLNVASLKRKSRENVYARKKAA